MGKVYNTQIIEQLTIEKDTEILIADLLLENSELKQRLSDIELILSEVMTNA